MAKRLKYNNRFVGKPFVSIALLAKYRKLIWLWLSRRANNIPNFRGFAEPSFPCHFPLFVPHMRPSLGLLSSFLQSCFIVKVLWERQCLYDISSPYTNPYPSFHHFFGLLWLPKRMGISVRVPDVINTYRGLLLMRFVFCCSSGAL